MGRLAFLNDNVAKILFSNKLCRVDRKEWLSKVLAPFVSGEDLERIDHLRPEDLVAPEILDKLANDEVAYASCKSTLFSCATTLVGRYSLMGANLVDATSFWIYEIRLAQKLAYLYGWDDFYFNARATQETLSRTVAILGYGLEIHSMKGVLLSVAYDLIPAVGEKLQGADCTPSQQECIKLTAQQLAVATKSIFSSLVGRQSSLGGVLLAGATNLFVYKRMARRMQEILQEVMYRRLDEKALY